MTAYTPLMHCCYCYYCCFSSSSGGGGSGGGNDDAYDNSGPWDWSIINYVWIYAMKKNVCPTE